MPESCACPLFVALLQSMGHKGSETNHPAAFPFPPYFMAYSMPYPEETDSAYVPPSPLMGSPVGTPTGQCFVSIFF